MIFFLLSFTRFSVERIENAGCQSSKKMEIHPRFRSFLQLYQLFFWLVFCACEYGRFFFMRREKNRTIEPMPEQKWTHEYGYRRRDKRMNKETRRTTDTECVFLIEPKQVEIT